MNGAVMVTANSKLKAIVERFVLEGKPPTIEEICNLGIDTKILETKLEVARPQLDDLSGYKVLEKWCYHRYESDSWAELVAKANLTGIQCIRFESTRKSSPYDGVRLLDTVPSANLDIEVFIARSGKWIVWTRSDVLGTAPSFTTHETVSSLLARFKKIAGTTYDFTAYGYDRDLHYWPEHQNGRHRVVSVALLLAAHLDDILRSSIWEKDRKLKTQVDALGGLNNVNTWSSVPIISPALPSH
jgi:hypothetical protein